MDRDEMLLYMPHRGRNVLIDGFTDLGNGTGRGTLRIAEGDEHGRDLFLVRSPEGPRYSAFFLVEHVALTSILILRSDMGGGRLAYFSAISRFRSRGVAAADTPLVSTVSRERDRGEFRSFAAEVATEDGEPILDVSFMAYLAPRGARPEPRPATAPPREFPPPTADAFPCFDPALVFLGGPDGDGAAGAVYPADHPLCEGHFPGAPVMMGMTQWLAVAQAAALAAGEPGRETEISGAGVLNHAAGGAIVDVAGLKIAVKKDGGGRVDDLRLLETKRVAFRDRVLPGDAYVADFTPKD